MCKPAIKFIEQKRAEETKFNVFQIEEKMKEILETKLKLQVKEAEYLELSNQKVQLLQNLKAIKCSSHERDAAENLILKYKLNKNKAE